jgi:hypothetical protein
MPFLCRNGLEATVELINSGDAAPNFVHVEKVALS